MEETVFTSGAILEILSQIEELSDYDISLDDTDGNITLSVGDSTYNISKPREEMEVPNDVVVQLADIAENAVSEYESQSIESGILKTVAKTIMLGGAVRLISKLLD
jgi:hypothetical protein